MQVRVRVAESSVRVAINWPAFIRISTTTHEVSQRRPPRVRARTHRNIVHVLEPIGYGYVVHVLEPVRYRFQLHTRLVR